MFFDVAGGESYRFKNFCKIVALSAGNYHGLAKC